MTSLLATALPCCRQATRSDHSRQQQHQLGWLPAPQRQVGSHHSSQQQAGNRLSVSGRALSGAAAELATYHFAQRHAGTTSEWFQAAVRDIVKHVDEAPMLQTVQLGVGGAEPRCSTYSVHPSVVAVPELWQGIAEHVSQHSADAVILVQRVSAHAAAAEAATPGPFDATASADEQQLQWEAAAAGASSSSSSPAGSPPGSPRGAGNHEMRVHAEEACRRLVSSGVADSILLHGQVGDCCDGDHTHGIAAPPSTAAGAAGAAPPSRPLPLPSIVPFSPSGSGAAMRRAVRAAALRPVGAGGFGSGACQQSTCYWGVVVQSRAHTGTEGCYLLKTVKNTSAATGCTCTHFSLTRIAHGDHLEQQFVQSWLL